MKQRKRAQEILAAGELTSFPDSGIRNYATDDEDPEVRERVAGARAWRGRGKRRASRSRQPRRIARRDPPAIANLYSYDLFGMPTVFRAGEPMLLALPMADKGFPAVNAATIQ